MSNGFDPYGGQLMMMPYGGGPPFSINPAEYYNNDVQPYSSDELSQKDSSIDSPVSGALRAQQFSSTIKYIAFDFRSHRRKIPSMTRKLRIAMKTMLPKLQKPSTILQRILSSLQMTKLRQT